MCIGENAGDSLREADTALIADAATRDLPDHKIMLRTNDAGMTWVVLDPDNPTLLRFTICRIDPCVMVLIEDPFARRQFRALGNIEDAMTFVRDAAGDATAAADRRVLH